MFNSPSKTTDRRWPLRLIWVGNGIPRVLHWTAGEARYYGWRWMIGVGPVIACIWPCIPDDCEGDRP